MEIMNGISLYIQNLIHSGGKRIAEENSVWVFHVFIVCCHFVWSHIYLFNGQSHQDKKNCFSYSHSHSTNRRQSTRHTITRTTLNLPIFHPPRSSIIYLWRIWIVLHTWNIESVRTFSNGDRHSTPALSSFDSSVSLLTASTRWYRGGTGTHPAFVWLITRFIDFALLE